VIPLFGVTNHSHLWAELAAIIAIAIDENIKTLKKPIAMAKAIRMIMKCSVTIIAITAVTIILWKSNCFRFCRFEKTKLLFMSYVIDFRVFERWVLMNMENGTAG